MKQPIPDITAKIYLVEYGYQIDIKIEGLDEELTEVKDYFDAYDLKKLRKFVAVKLLDCMKDLEHDPAIRKIIKKEKKNE
jgi:hypothetical protein